MKSKTNTILYVGTVLMLIFLYQFTLNQYRNNYVNQTDVVLQNQLDVVEPLLQELNMNEIGVFLYGLDLKTGIRFTLYDVNQVVLFDSRNEVNLEEIPKLTSFVFTNNTSQLLDVDRSDGSWVSKAVRIQNQDVHTIQVSELLNYTSSISIHLTFLMTFLIMTAIYGWTLYSQSEKNKHFIQEITKVLTSISTKHMYERTPTTEQFDDGLELIEKSYQRIQEKYDYRKGQLEAILSSLSIGLIAVDLEGKIIFSNRKANELFGVNLTTARQSIYHLVYDKHVHQIMDELKNQEFSEIQYVESTTGLLLNYSGIGIFSKLKRIGSLVLIEDVTKVAQLEKLKQDFVSNVTHELKTPLTSIQGFSETLQQMDPNDAKFNEFLNIINMESVRLNGLINDILVLSDLEGKEKQDERRWVDINRISREVIDLLEIQKKPSVSLTIKASKNYLVYFDRYQLKQLILNLVSNALKYTDKGSVIIDLSETKHVIIMKVIDTGIGIPLEEQGRIFERFYRVNKDRSRKTGGTGLGLSIVKHIVENNNCEIYLKSTEGEGTCITVEFQKTEL